MKTIAVIPARGGSKRIPRKNIREFAGSPMLAWSVSAAQKSGLFDKVIVSTDDDEIALIARAAGAEVPFRRPAALADDIAPTVPVIAHAIQACIDLGWPVAHACCIYPCAPFIVPDDLRRAYALLLSSGTPFVFPVTDYPHPVQRAMRRLPSGKMEFFSREHELTRTQDLEKSYHDAGQFYWGTAQAWLTHKRMHTDGIGMPIPHWRVVDIDTPDDWQRGELMFGLLKHQTEGAVA